jgi:hypothetical protein
MARRVPSRDQPNSSIVSPSLKRVSWREGAPSSGQVRWEDLDGERPLETGIARPVHLAHTTRAKRGDDFIRAETRATFEGHRRGWRDYRRNERHEDRVTDPAERWRDVRRFLPRVAGGDVQELPSTLAAIVGSFYR